MQKPNIIFILSDQQRWDTCGCYGQPLPITPNLDSLAERGVRFKHAFTCQPVCGSLRACLQSGKYATEIGCHVNNKRLPLDTNNLAHCMSDAGYEVGYLGKWHLASCGEKDRPDNYRDRAVPAELRGGYKDFWLASDVLEFTSHSYDGHMFDADGNKREFPKSRYRVDAQTDWALEYLETRTGEKPFFLFLSYIEPHHQNDHKCYEGAKGSKEKYKDFPVPGDLEGKAGDWQKEYPDYLGCINSLDENIGRIEAELEKLGLTENTLLIYTSDHGSHFRTRNAEYKRACHEGCIRVPFIAKGPSFEGGAVVDKLISLIDVAPTILRAGGASIPSGMRGRPIQDALAGATDWPEEIFLQISESHCGRAIRTKKWKYSVRAEHGDGHLPSADVYIEDFLYDLEADPDENNNLIANKEQAEVRKNLSETLKQRMKKAGETVPEILEKSET